MDVFQDLVAVVLYVLEDAADGVALDNRVDLVVGLAVEGDMHGVGVAEQVVHVAEDLLVGADQEKADVVVLVRFDAVERQAAGGAVFANEVGNLAVGIAGDVGDGGEDLRLLLKPLDGHDGEHLVDGPGVGNGLEHGEVGETGAPQAQLEVLHLLGNGFQPLDDLVHAGDNLGVEPFGDGAILQGQKAQLEQADRLLNQLDGVVIVLAQAVSVDAVVDVEQLAHGGRQLVRAGKRRLEVGRRRFRARVQQVGDQHRVMRRHGASRFGDDVGAGHAGLVADAPDLVNHVVGVLVDGVVDAGVVARLGTVVVHAQTAADIHVTDVRPHLFQLGVDAGALDERVLDLVHLGDLTADMEVDQPQVFEQVVLLEQVERGEQFGNPQAELGVFSAGS